MKILGPGCPKFVVSLCGLELSASSIIPSMTSKLSRKPCQVDVRIDPNLDHGVSVVSAFIVDVDLDGSAGIHVRGVSRELGIVHDVEVDDNLVVGVDAVGDHVCVVGCGLIVVHAGEVGDNLTVGVGVVGDRVCVVGCGLIVVHDGEVYSMKDFSSLSPLSIQTRQRCGIADPCLVRRWCSS